MSGGAAKFLGPDIVARAQARLAAVQALYQMDLAQSDLNEVIWEFVCHRFGDKAEVDDVRAADPVFFSQLIKGVVARQRDIDPLLDQQLAAGWRLVRIDSILRAVLRGGLYELMERQDVPARVVIDEYIEVAHAFFAGEEPKVVNGILDKLARKLRPGEFCQLAKS
jgi:N utilization substance protein B